MSVHPDTELEQIQTRLDRHVPRTKAPISVYESERLRSRVLMIVRLTIFGVVGTGALMFLHHQMKAPVMMAGPLSAGMAAFFAMVPMTTTGHGGWVGALTRWWLGHSDRDEPITEREAALVGDWAPRYPCLRDAGVAWAAANEECTLGRRDFMVLERAHDALAVRSKRLDSHADERTRRAHVQDKLNTHGMLADAKRLQEHNQLEAITHDPDRPDEGKRRM